MAKSISFHDLFIHHHRQFQTGAVNESPGMLNSLLESPGSRPRATYETAMKVPGKLLTSSITGAKKNETDSRKILFSRVQNMRQIIVVGPYAPSPLPNHEIQEFTIGDFAKNESGTFGGSLGIPDSVITFGRDASAKTNWSQA